tara:strand:- start:103 stop:447 length:345 start_codon:yes stop_codon:yes gene_type:complete
MKSQLKPREDGQYIIQVLLPPHRGKLFIDHLSKLQEVLEMKPSSFIREMVFKFLENNLPEETYKKAADKDDSNWKRIVRNRAEGKKRALNARKLLQKNASNDEISKKNRPEISG